MPAARGRYWLLADVTSLSSKNTILSTKLMNNWDFYDSIFIAIFYRSHVWQIDKTSDYTNSSTVILRAHKENLFKRDSLRQFLYDNQLCYMRSGDLLYWHSLLTSWMSERKDRQLTILLIACAEKKRNVRWGWERHNGSFLKIVSHISYLSTSSKIAAMYKKRLKYQTEEKVIRKLPKHCKYSWQRNCLFLLCSKELCHTRH